MFREIRVAYLTTFTLGVVMFQLVSVSPSMAQEQAPQKIATEYRSPSGIRWDVHVPFEKLNLVVTSSEAEVYRGEFDQAPSFSLVDDNGDLLPDGRYNYELTIVPQIDPSVRQQLQAARESGDDALLRQLMEKYGISSKGASYSGNFTVHYRTMVTSQGDEKPALSRRRRIAKRQQRYTAAPADLSDTPIGPADQVILDDLIVDGSACVGFDCVNGESFGFDTIRLKENNLRIKFQDTSSSASFPSNDWQITANDSANGGANKFSIDDIDGGRTPFTIEAGAPSHSLYVDDGGRIGFGTSTPVVDLHVKSGNTPTLRLEQDGSSGFTPQTWDVAGNEANFFIRDATNGSTLPFRIRPGAPSSAIDIAGDGDVGIGTASPSAPLHVRRTNGTAAILVEEANGTSEARTLFEIRNNGPAQLALNDSSNGNNWVFNNWGGFGISKVGTGGAELFINASGEVRMGPGGASNFTLDSLGNLSVAGVKNFVMADPEDPEREIFYAALEGPEAGTYHRGTASTVGGEAVIELPRHFTKVTEVEGITVQLTCLGGWHRLYVLEKSTERIVVRDAEGGDGIEFDFFVQGVRKGYADYEVERQVRPPSAGELQN